MHPDLQSYFKFTGKSRLDKSVNSLLGLLEGIAVDGQVTPGEVAVLRMWLSDHADVAHKHPFNELTAAVAAAVSDGVLDGEERQALPLAAGRYAYVHVARGSLEVNGQRLDEGDGARLRDPGEIRLSGGRAAEVLLFDLRPNELPSY